MDSALNLPAEPSAGREQRPPGSSRAVAVEIAGGEGSGASKEQWARYEPRLVSVQCPAFYLKVAGAQGD